MATQDSQIKYLLSYYEDKPEGLVNSADVFLVLDTGEELPVHSAFLSAQSQVFCDMLSNDDLLCTSKAKLRRLPLKDCTREAACAWLSYAYHARKPCSLVEADDVLHLAHMFNMREILDRFDEFLVGLDSLWVRSICLHRPTAKEAQSPEKSNTCNCPALLNCMQDAWKQQP